LNLYGFVFNNPNQFYDRLGRDPQLNTPGPENSCTPLSGGPSRDFTAAERKCVNQIGRTEGCWECGKKSPGTTSGNFIIDHQPPNALNPEGNLQSGYAHCKWCSASQGGRIRGILRTGGKVIGVAGTILSLAFPDDLNAAEDSELAYWNECIEPTQLIFLNKHKENGRYYCTYLGGFRDKCCGGKVISMEHQKIEVGECDTCPKNPCEFPPGTSIFHEEIDSVYPGH